MQNQDESVTFPVEFFCPPEEEEKATTISTQCNFERGRGAVRQKFTEKKRKIFVLSGAGKRRRQIMRQLGERNIIAKEGKRNRCLRVNEKDGRESSRVKTKKKEGEER